MRRRCSRLRRPCAGLPRLHAEARILLPTRSMTKRIPVGVFFALFTVSGFAGLIYESIWSHYLKLFLGHAAYAQSLVLVVFMGGMAAGAAWCARLSERLERP